MNKGAEKSRQLKTTLREKVEYEEKYAHSISKSEKQKKYEKMLNSKAESRDFLSRMEQDNKKRAEVGNQLTIQMRWMNSTESQLSLFDDRRTLMSVNG